MTNPLLEACFPSERDIDLQRVAPASRAAVYVVATGGSDPGALEVLSFDDAASAFLPEFTSFEIERVDAAPLNVAQPAIVPPAPRSRVGALLACGTGAAGVLIAASLGPQLMSTSSAPAFTSADVAWPRAPSPTLAHLQPVAEPAFVPASTAEHQADASVRESRPALALKAERLQTAPTRETSPATPVADATIDARAQRDSPAVLITPDVASTSLPELVAPPRVVDAPAAVVASRAADGVEPRPVAVPPPAAVLPPAAGVAAAIDRPAAPVAPSTSVQPVRDLLARYRTAYESLDARSAKQIWPSVDQRALARAFDGLDSQTMTFDACDILVNDARASASCRGSASYVTRVGNRSVHAAGRQWTFQMEKAADHWVIVSVQTR